MLTLMLHTCVNINADINAGINVVLTAITWQFSFAAAVFHTVATRAGLVHDSQ